MDKFHMPHGQSFGYLYQAALADGLVRDQQSRTLGCKLPCSTYCSAGKEQFANRGVAGVGRGDGPSWCWVRIPPRKLRSRFQEFKHTSLIFLAGKFSEGELPLYGVLRSSSHLP